MSFRLREYVRNLPGIAISVGIAASATALYLTNNSTGIEGTTTGVVTRAAVLSATYYTLPSPLLYVRLDDDKQEVQVGIPRHVPVRVGERVQLNVERRLLSGSKDYSFVQYIDDEPYQPPQTATESGG